MAKKELDATAKQARDDFAVAYLKEHKEAGSKEIQKAAGYKAAWGDIPGRTLGALRIDAGITSPATNGGTATSPKKKTPSGEIGIKDIETAYAFAKEHYDGSIDEAVTHLNALALMGDIKHVVKSLEKAKELQALLVGKSK
jgi:hypothetical protein